MSPENFPLYELLKLSAILAVLLLIYYFTVKALFSKKLKIVTVIDGDTYVGVSQKGRQYRLRLEGLDCPEMLQESGQFVKSQITPILEGKWVRVYFKGTDRYKRKLVKIKLGRHDLTQLMLSNGWAYPTNTLSFGYYWARLTRKGIFSGSFRTSNQHPGLFKSKNRFRIWLNYKLKAKKQAK